jgi:hypothetical protein
LAAASRGSWRAWEGSATSEWRIARAARAVADRDFFAGDFLGGGDDFLHGNADAGAEVAAQGFPAGGQMIEREGMGVGEILDVDVIPDAGAVRSVVIGAENLDDRFPRSRPSGRGG